MPKDENNEISIGFDKITLRFADAEPIVIPRASLRTRLQLIDWVYRLTGWPGMNLRRLQFFIAAIFHHHGWPLPELTDNRFAYRTDVRGETVTSAG